jgi:hypothetical protein
VNKVNTTANRSINLLAKMVLHIVPSTVTSKTSRYDPISQKNNPNKSLKLDSFVQWLNAHISVILGHHETMSQKIKISALMINGPNIYEHLLSIDGSTKLSSRGLGTHLDIPSHPF